MTIETLENSVVLAIDGQEFDTALVCRAGDDFPSHDEDFLGGDGQILACLDGRQCGLETCRADNGDEHDVGLW